MNKDFQLQQLNIMLMDPGVKSGLKVYHNPIKSKQ